MMRNSLFLAIGLALLLLLMLFSLGTGSMDLAWPAILRATFDHDPSDTVSVVVHDLRLPRVVTAALVGACLAFAGYLMQVMVNNPLADPYILGTASGAALGANLAYVGVLPFYLLGVYLLPFYAFIGAFGITLLVVGMATRGGRIMPTHLLLGGIAITALLGAAISFVTFTSDSEGKLRSVVFWVMGSFERANWHMIPFPAIALGIALLGFTFYHKHMGILLLGERRAISLGVNVKKVKWALLLTSALVTGMAIAASGPIGFVGLIVPHVVRAMFGVNGRLNLLHCAVLGAIFTVASDLLARLAYPPAGLPVGIITSFIGIPFFVYLLFKSNYRFH